MGIVTNLVPGPHNIISTDYWIVNPSIAGFTYPWSIHAPVLIYQDLMERRKFDLSLSSDSDTN